MDDQHCQATTKDGKPCSARVRTGRPYCAWHDPEIVAERAEWTRKGGEGRSNANRAAKALPDDLKDVGQMLLTAMRDVRDGKLDPKVASALASLSNAYRGIFEVGQVDAKLSEIDARLAAAEEGRR